MKFRVLSDRQIEQIHSATLEVLQRIGVRVLHEEGLRLLEEAGCMLRKDGIVKIPSHLVEDAIRSAPPKVVLSNREGHRFMFLEGNRTYYGTGSDDQNIWDPYTGERRRAQKTDIGNVAKVCDALPNLSFVMSLGLANDCHVKVSDIHQFQAMLENTSKPILFTSHNLENTKIIRDIAWEVAGGKEVFQENPFIINYTEVISPLTHSPGGVDKLLFSAENQIPVVYVSGAMSGATAPVTIAGSLVLINAEALSGLLMHQLKRRGAPIISGGMATIIDMRSSRFISGSPELQLVHAATADLYHHYRIPVWGSAGFSDAKILDQQAAIEATFQCLMAAQCGQNLVHDVGHLDCGLTGSLELVVMTDEIVDMVKRIMRGIEITEESLALDEIERVGPGGEFISSELTCELFKSEHWYPSLLDRNNFEQWSNEGGKDLGTKLNEKVREILETHQPAPLAQRAKESVDKIIEDYEKSVTNTA